MNDELKHLTKKERKKLAKERKNQQRIKRENREKLSKWALGIATLLIIVFGVYWLVKQNSKYSSNSTFYSVKSATASDWVKGNKQAKIVLIEYSDFQCPACASYYPIVKQLAEESSQSAQFVYRHFPLSTIHANADLAARAAEAAGRQDKFWQMHDKLFENQTEWANERNPVDTFAKYAEELNLDINKFRNDLDLQEIKEKVRKDIRSGEVAEVNATPTFFVNGKKIQSPRSYEEFLKKIEEEINKNES